MRTFIISLKEPGDVRNRELVTLLGQIGFEAEIFPAVDGRELSAGRYFDAIQHYLGVRGTLLTPSELGCSLSHTSVCNRIVAEGVTSAVVLEDDALVDRESLKLLAKLQELVLFNSGLIHLGGQEGVEHLTRRAHGTPDPRLDGFWKVNPDDLSAVYRTVGYMVSFKDAKRLAELGALGAYLSDDWSYVMGQNALDAFYICDCIGHPTNNSASRIESERKFLRKLTKKIDMSLAARILREIKRTVAARREDSRRKRRAQGQEKIAWKSRWSAGG